MPDDRLDLRDTVMWGRRIAGLGGEVYEHRGRLDEMDKRMARCEETRTDDMVKVAECWEAIKIIRDDSEKRIGALEKALAAERELRDRERREHVTLHGKLNTRIKERLGEKPKPQGEMQDDGHEADQSTSVRM